ncbi:MAG: ABC transporter substrate-binding protein [Saprospiraceae bacterium]
MQAPSPLLRTLLWLSALLLLAGCELFKPLVVDNGDTPQTSDRDRDRTDLDPIQGRRVYDPVTGRYVVVNNAPTEPMDTIKWTVLSERDYPPITQEGVDVFRGNRAGGATAVGGTTTPTAGGFNAVEQTGQGTDGSRMLTAYNVDYILPFLANQTGENNEIDVNSLWALNFYGGSQMALDELQKSSTLKLNVLSEDTQASPERVSSLLSTSVALRNSHVIIGPYLRDNVAQVAEAAKRSGQVLISPYSAAGGVTENNPQYIQVNPTLETHCRAILQHVVRTERSERIVLVSGSTPAQTSRLALFQTEYKIATGNPNVAPLEELVIDGRNFSLQPYLGGSVTFIVPMYEDETFVANFLGTLYNSIRNGRSEVAVYGLPQWRDYENVDFDYYEGCNVHVSSSVFIDQLDPGVRTFRRDFYNRYGALPREEAFVGYGLTKYFMRLLGQYGTQFQYQLEREPEDLLHTRMRFERVVSTPAIPGGTERPVLERWENKYVNILEFKDYRFRRVN